MMRCYGIKKDYITSKYFWSYHHDMHIIASIKFYTKEIICEI